MADQSPDERAAGGTRGRAYLPLLGALVVGLVLSAVATGWTYQREREDAAVETDNRMMEVGNALDHQVSGYAEALYGLRSAIAQDPAMSRTEFRQLVDIEDLTRRNPGAESVTFDRRVATRHLDDFERRIGRQVPGFAVHPPSSRRDHVVVEYVEPYDPGSPALGLDIAADPVRRSALEFARDTGELAATQPLELVQTPVARGFLLMLAAYDVSPVPVTAPARRRHFVGVLVAVFTTEEIVELALGAEPGLDISIYDAGSAVDTPRTRPLPADWITGDRVVDYSNYADIDAGSRRWRLVTDEPVAMSFAAPVATAVSGIALTLLIVGVLGAMALSRRRAVILADRMTEDLRVSQERLREANESMRGFVDVAAHDLRSPLISIAGFSAILSEDDGTFPAENRRRAAVAIERQSRNMAHLIDDLLTLSTIDGDGPASRPAAVNVAAAITECLDENGTAPQVVVDCPSDLVVVVDPRHLRRILDNYLQNALKYGAAPISVEATRTGDAAEIRVIDHGPGVPPEFVPRLFGKFARADTPETRAQPGTGLGLSIVRGLAEANGGTATYTPHLPRGSRFAVRLPAGR